MVEIVLISLTSPLNIGWRHTRVSIVEESLTRALIVRQGTHPSLIRVLVTIKTLVLTNLYSILRVSHSSLTVVSSVEVHIIVMITKHGTCLSMIRVLVTIKTLVMTNLHFILHISNNNTTVVRSMEVPIIAQIVKPGTSLSMSLILEEFLRAQKANSPVVLKEPEWSDDYTEVTYDNEQCLSDHYTAPVTPPAYTPSISFLAIMEPAGTILIGDEFITNYSCKGNCTFREFEDISSLDLPESTQVIDESSLLVTPLLDPKQICLKEVERFDPFFSLTQSGGTTRVMETLSFSSHHMPSPRPAAYSPKEVVYCYYPPHLTSGDGLDHGPKMK
ncbi:hypothetical protein Tco_0675224 [Tanacetum coccineum]